MKYKRDNVIVENCHVGIFINDEVRFPVMIYNFPDNDLPHVMDRQEFLKVFTPLYPEFDEKEKHEDME